MHQRSLATVLTCLGMTTIALGVVPRVDAAEDYQGRTHYFGELHTHTGVSGDGGSNDLGNCNTPGACGNFSEFFVIARDTARLDFCAITDHANGPSEMDVEDWLATLSLVAEANDPEGGFVSLLGAELAHIFPDSVRMGHRNTILFGDDDTLADLLLSDVQLAGEAVTCDGIWAALEVLDMQYGPVLNIPHHPAPDRPMPTDWSCHNQHFSPVVEVYSAHGNSRDIQANELYDMSHFELEPGSTVNEALSYEQWGHRLGLIGGTDLHDTMPGMICHLDAHQDGHEYSGSLTGLFLDDDTPLSRLALYEAIRARHTYATTGPKIPLTFALVDGDGEELAVMGDVYSPPPQEGARLRVSMPTYALPYVPSVELNDRNGVVRPMVEVASGVFEVELMHVELPWWGYATIYLDGENWWSDLDVECEDGGDSLDERIWTSPIWIEWFDGEDDDGDGISDLGGDCDDLDPTVHPGATEVPNGRDDDCDGLVDEPATAVDLDGDGFAERDCDDGDDRVYPGAPPRCDGAQDNDCDGILDANEADADEDGWSPCDGDCDDNDARVHPAADPACDGVIDNDCDGVADADEADRDGDGITVCDGDCDDHDLLVRPGAAEVRNGLDDDCDGEVDEGLGGCGASLAGAGPSPSRVALALGIAGALWRRRARA